MRARAADPIRDKKLIFQIAKELNHIHPRYKMIWLFGIYSGLRISDILKLTISEVQNADFIEVTEKKTGKKKKFPIKKELQQALKWYIPLRLNDNQTGDMLFAGARTKTLDRGEMNRAMNKVAAKLGIKSHFSTHTMRKTFGYHHYQQFHDVVALQKIFNHSSSQITLRYIGIVQDEIDQSYNQFSYNYNAKKKVTTATPEINKVSEVTKALELLVTQLKPIQQKQKQKDKKYINTYKFLLDYIQNGGIRHRAFAELALQADD